MSGSRKWFIYTTDQGTDFAINLDESNTEAVNAGTQDYVTGSSTIFAVPRNVKPRKLRFRSLDGRYVREVIALTPTIFSAVTASSSIFADDARAIELFLASKSGEKLRVPFAVDTGLNDGDNT